jgi:hypothetical protein
MGAIPAGTVEAVDHAAAQSDRWCFLAALVVLGMLGVWVVRYFAKQHEQLLAEHRASRECYQESLRGVVAEQAAANVKLVSCLEANTRFLEECRDGLRHLVERKRI